MTDDFRIDVPFGKRPPRLKDLVNNDLYVQIRKNHADGKFLSKCASCDMPKQKDL